MTRSGPSVGAASLQLAEDYAAQLDALGRRSEAATYRILLRSLRGILGELRRAYGRYLDVEQPDAIDPAGNAMQRSGAAVVREASSRLLTVLNAAEEFMPERELREWEERFTTDLETAQRLGGELGVQLAQLVADAPSAIQGGYNAPAVEAASRSASAYIRNVSSDFRQQIVQITGEAAARGWGPSRMELQVRRALAGEGQTAGLRQRAALIARSELANAYVQGQIDNARRNRFDYVRWVAVRDERTCPFCVSRHGQIYPVSSVVMPAHPRCRCVASPVPQAAVEGDPEVRRALTDEAYWEESQKQAWSEYAEAKGKTLEEVRGELVRAQRQPTASERRRYPGIPSSLPPSLAVRWYEGAEG